MNKAVFLPMNTNHVLIASAIIKHLNTDYEMLCHDRLCFGTQYLTEGILQELQIPYSHFDKRCAIEPTAPFRGQLVSYLGIRKIVRRKILSSLPAVVVLFVDNDPISHIIIQITKKMGIKTLLIQDGLIRPDEYSSKQAPRAKAAEWLQHRMGVAVRPTIYGKGGCTAVVVNGKIAYEILRKRGISEADMVILGQPKYDDFMKEAASKITATGQKRYLFAATKDLIRGEPHIRFLRKLVEGCGRLGISLVVKIHPRSPEKPADVIKVIGGNAKHFPEVIKEGDDTVSVLKSCDAIITLSSTVILEALMLDREALAVHYLAGDQNLRHYDKYGAIFAVQDEDDIVKVLQESLRDKKPYKCKAALLEDELFSLDGQAGCRVAKIIEDMAGSYC